MSDDNRPDSAGGRFPTVAELRVDGLLSIDVSVFQRIFTLLLTVFVVGIIGISLTYGREASLFPLVVAVPTLTLLIGLLAIQTIPPLRAYAQTLESSSMFDADSIGDSDAQSSSSAPIETIRANAIRVLGWIGLLAISILLFGHVIGLAVSLIVVFRYYSNLSWIRAILSALVNVAFLTALFLIIFSARLYPGILFG